MNEPPYIVHQRYAKVHPRFHIVVDIAQKPVFPQVGDRIGDQVDNDHQCRAQQQYKPRIAHAAQHYPPHSQSTPLQRRQEKLRKREIDIAKEHERQTVEDRHAEYDQVVFERMVVINVPAERKVKVDAAPFSGPCHELAADQPNQRTPHPLLEIGQHQKCAEKACDIGSKKLRTILITESLDNHFHQYLMANWVWTCSRTALNIFPHNQETLSFAFF
jgi:hypothetical protein